VAGFGRDEEKFQTFWPQVRHLVGKDILRFHAVLWPAMLLAAELPLPRMIFAHGWWTVEKEKMSKSKGNVVDPNRIIECYGVDRFRYFLMREVTFGLDGDFSEKALIERTNADLSDNFGNLVHRTSSMAWKYLGGKVKRPSLYQDEEWEKLLAEVKSSVAFYFERFGFAQVLESIWRLVHFGNRYIDQKAPWRLSKDPEKKEELTGILYRLLDCARILAVMVYPFCPHSCSRLWKALGLGDFPGFDSFEREVSWESGPEVFNLEKPTPLFPRIEN
jgi:methionyl-tRNA synthetase